MLMLLRLIFAALNYLLGLLAITDEAIGYVQYFIFTVSLPQSILASYIVLICVPSEAHHETMIQVSFLYLRRARIPTGKEGSTQERQSNQ